jgi:MFS family permease
MSSFSGILSYGIGEMRGTAGYSGWRWIFIIEGCITVALGLLGFFLIVNFPDKAKFITEEERAIVMGRLNADRGDAEDDHITFRKCLLHMKDWKMCYLSFIYVCNTLPCYGMSYFISVILRGFGYSVGMSQLLTAPPFCAAMIIQLVTSWFSDHYHIRSPFILGHALFTVVGFGMMVGSNDNAVKYAGAIIGVIGCQPNQAFLLSYLQNNIVGTSKRAVASAMQIGGCAIGGIIASTVFRQQDAPKYLPGLAVTLSMVSIMFLMLILFAGILWRENRKLARGTRGPIEGMIGFKYTL